MFKVGDRVYDIMRKKWGVVTGVESKVHVVFAHNEPTYCYTKDGRLGDDTEVRRLYFIEFDIFVPEEALEKPKWRAKDGGFYYYVDTYGYVVESTELGDKCDDLLHTARNYFRNSHEAKQSKIYKGFVEQLND